ncbi:MAG: hypothetical protein Q8J64_09850 [Thermodesulfovibrionales bacterium]|nr:hypothetical protein [Thermodesulfovibrionales bacterium]
MTRKILISMLLVFALAGYAMAEEGMSPAKAAQIDDTFSRATQWLKQENLSVTTSPEQAFIGDYILVIGEGLPSASSKSPAQKRLTAERAATAIAYRALAEMLEGVAVVGDTLVKDAELQYDVVRTAVAGFVKGAQTVYKDYNKEEETALVVVKIGMSGPQGFAKTMYEKLIGDPAIKKTVVAPKPEFTATPVALEEKYDGLIIDATEYTFRPALINRIFTPKGEVIYDPSRISQKVLVEQGCGDYTNSVDKAKAALSSRGAKNPLVVKAAASVNPSDLQVSDNDSIRIFSANQKTAFLAEAKVAFVLK